MDKLLSIVVPVYKVEKYISKCLDSLIVSDDVMEKMANKPTKYIDKFLNSGAYYDNDGATIIPSMDKNKVEHPYLVAEAND